MTNARGYPQRIESAVAMRPKNASRSPSSQPSSTVGRHATRASARARAGDRERSARNQEAEVGSRRIVELLVSFARHRLTIHSFIHSFIHLHCEGRRHRFDSVHLTNTAPSGPLSDSTDDGPLYGQLEGKNYLG